jgi:Ca-activated chloride channel family protein
MVKGAVNRVVILSDGDANVGPSSYEELTKQIEQYKGQGITLSTVGFGNGNYTYIDDEEQAKRVFGHEVSGLLQVIARDVKVQVEFDPKVVKEYRLVGYENRDVKDADFKNDKVDGGEIGAGHDVTALYDVVLTSTDASPLTVHVRWKPPIGGDAKESAFVMPKESIATTFAAAPANLRFAVGAMGFAELLRKSPLAKEWTWAEVRSIVKEAGGNAADRTQLLDLIARAEKLSGVQ